MNKFFTLFLSAFSFAGVFAQPIGAPIPGQNTPLENHKTQPEWGYTTKSAGDSCGFYFNNYVGLAKTSSVLQEYMRTGDVINDFYYAGRAQRFSVTQPVEVGGVEFYAYHETAFDSVMVITTLHAYTSSNDSLGPELARDTCYVTHTAFTLVLPNIAVQSYFDTPVTMTDDFVIAMHSTEDLDLVIITNDWNANDGNGESNSFALYLNPAYSTDDGWYSAQGYFGADYDYLMSPYVNYDLYTPFTVLEDSICPDVVNAGCVDYIQLPHYTNHMYNSQYASSSTHIRWLWGDGYQNVDLLNACHTYANPGTFDITLQDTLFRYDFNSPHCIVVVTQPIVALDVPVPTFTFIQDGLTVDFTNTSANYDSLWWDYGDVSTGSDLETPSHSYTSVGVFDVWLHVFNACYEDSTMLQVTTDDVGIKNNEPHFEIYPNPANNYVTISGLTGESQIELMNILGERILYLRTSDSKEMLNLSEFATGTYFIKITHNDDQTTQKLIIRH
ncbi:MAG: T9SS type A sorting domain-containing protein [Crocinitomicaceae bacterium]|nr:T9SS type A sorting domain-containing protein [Crocinitomicaceae bacterium]